MAGNLAAFSTCAVAPLVASLQPTFACPCWELRSRHGVAKRRRNRQTIHYSNVLARTCWVVFLLQAKHLTDLTNRSPSRYPLERCPYVYSNMYIYIWYPPKCLPLLILIGICGALCTLFLVCFGEQIWGESGCHTYRLLHVCFWYLSLKYISLYWVIRFWTIYIFTSTFDFAAPRAVQVEDCTLKQNKNMFSAVLRNLKTSDIFQSLLEPRTTNQDCT